jgi:hypothetical protein
VAVGRRVGVGRRYGASPADASAGRLRRAGACSDRWTGAANAAAVAASTAAHDDPDRTSTITSDNHPAVAPTDDDRPSGTDDADAADDDATAESGTDAGCHRCAATRLGERSDRARGRGGNWCA